MASSLEPRSESSIKRLDLKSPRDLSYLKIQTPEFKLSDQVSMTQFADANAVGGSPVVGVTSSDTSPIELRAFAGEVVSVARVAAPIAPFPGQRRFALKLPPSTFAVPGGPVVDSEQHIVGIVTSVSTRDGQLSVPVDVAMAFLRKQVGPPPVPTRLRIVQ